MEDAPRHVTLWTGYHIRFGSAVLRDSEVVRADRLQYIQPFRRHIHDPNTVVYQQYSTFSGGQRIPYLGPCGNVELHECHGGMYGYSRVVR